MGRKMEVSILTLSFAKIDILTKDRKANKTKLETQCFNRFCVVKGDQTDLGLLFSSCTI